MRIRSGDVLFSLVRPYLKNIAVVLTDLDNQVASTAYCVLRPAPGIESAFLFYQLVQESFIHSIPTYGNSPPAARDDEFLAAVVRIAPSDEQRRIVQKIEELFSKLDAGVSALERVKAALKRYRAAVLKSAVEGKLTAEWRAHHPAKENGAHLLRRILDERRRKWEQEQRAKYAKTGKQPPKDWQAKYKEPAVPNTSELPPLPEGWCWATVEQIAEVQGGITKDQKRQRTVTMREVPYLRVANVQRGYLDLKESKTILAEAEEIEHLRLEKGDILFTEGGDRDKLGRGWVWNGEIEECIHQNHIFRARLYAPWIHAKFVSYHGNHFGRHWFTRTGKQTTNLASINKTVLCCFPVPLPPAEEQDHIVAEVERRLSVVDEIEAQIEASLKRASRLRQSILKRAFVGRLVSQDPHDEPAEQLLERIRQQRQVVAGNGEPAGKRRSPSTRRNDRPALFNET
ncbi:MAG: restriction endonuclease subunit S [Gemmataceae bacterium]